MKLYQEILEKSKPVDEKFSKLPLAEIDSVKIVFNVPKFHPRSKVISNYSFSSLEMDYLPKDRRYYSKKNHIFIIDESIQKQNFIEKFIQENRVKTIFLKAIEDKVKTKPFLDELLKKHDIKNIINPMLITVGGGLLLNIGAYIAERISADLILFPTTVLSMADGSGGKVRVNFLSTKRAYKHFYKSYYEPNAIFLDDRFLDSLPEKQIKIGLVEIIKHGLFQSPELYDYLLKSGKKLFENKKTLKKSILWAADLKRVCMDVDVEENENGSRRILRGGHDFSDRLEEDMRLKIPHGIAVAIGIIRQLEMEKDDALLNKAETIFDLFGIPSTVKNFRK